METAIQTYTERMELEIRRTLPTSAVVMQALTTEERKVLEISCKPHLNEMNQQDALYKFGTMVRYIAIDTGYKIPDAGTWQYIQSRLFTFLLEHYGGLSLEDIKQAFDLLALGRLDMYLPKNSYGTAERSHYQAFTPEYFARILNAYMQVQGEVISKARRAMPAEQKPRSNEGERYWNMKLREAFYIYKYRGKFELSPYLVLHALKWLRAIHYDVEIEITEQDKRRAFYKYLADANKGLKNENEAVYVRRKGIEAEALQGATMSNAQERLIRQYFDELINR